MISEIVIGGFRNDMCVDAGGVNDWGRQRYSSEVGIEYATIRVEGANEFFKLAVVEGSRGVYRRTLAW